MRIIGGTARGLHLAPVGAGDAAAHLRPTSDRVREAIFNLLINGRIAAGGNPVSAARVLDLFAGTGALGLEALSRGAAHATFVDDGRAAQTLLQRNIDALRAIPTTRILRANATRLPPNPGPSFSLIFLDPPYGQTLGEAALASARAGNWLAPGAVVVWEESRPPAPPAGFTVLDQRKYGGTVITLLRAPADTP
ncbi:MAG: 16S rRNA (guanine(966)-N(2))-methyltransferase RsmD [Pseudorhodobacter sp.]|nr:16S rRNA (guanine(966)-N(2))-methyltransferase RsmD [Pseudorhodobacter sp.]